MQIQPATALDAGIPTDAFDLPTTPDKLEQRNIVRCGIVKQMAAAVEGRIRAHGIQPDKLTLAELLHEQGFTAGQIVEHIDDVTAAVAEIFR